METETISIEQPKLDTNKIEKAEEKKNNCPKCGKFMKIVMVANDENLPGVYCECGQALALPSHPPKLRDWYSVCGESLTQLITAFPLNETARTHIHSHLGMPVPKSCKTFLEIREWLVTVPLPGADEVPFDISKTALTPDTARRTAIVMDVHYSYQETGRCDYSATCSGHAEYELSHGDIERLAESAEGFADLLDQVKDALTTFCGDDPPDTERTEEDTSNHEECDGDHHYYELDNRLLRQKLAMYLHDHLPEYYTSLGVDV